MFLTKAANVPTPQDYVLKMREPFRIPEAGTDVFFEYIVALKPNAPFEYVEIGGLAFQKRVYPTAKSLQVNRDKSFDPQFQVYRLTEKQADALRKRASEINKRIPARHNHDFEPGNGQPEMLEPTEVNVGDWIILQRVDVAGHGSFVYLENTARQDVRHEQEQIDAFKDSILEAQKPPKKRI